MSAEQTLNEPEQILLHFFYTINTSAVLFLQKCESHTVFPSCELSLEFYYTISFLTKLFIRKIRMCCLDITFDIILQFFGCHSTLTI